MNLYFLKKIKHLVTYYMSIIKHDDFIEYHSFPFDTNQKLPNGAEEVMKNCCNILKSLNVNYRISDGTILGIYRNGTFIAHDNDIDVEIVGDKKVKEIEKKFKNMGMILGRKVIYKGKVQQIVYYTSNHIIFDVVIWHFFENNKIYNYSEKGYERIQDAKYFQKNKLEYIKFKGNKYPIPTPIEEWLEMRYGRDWRTPKTYKGDWKEECFDMKRIKND
jgi:hypothetical protein